MNTENIKRIAEGMGLDGYQTVDGFAVATEDGVSTGIITKLFNPYKDDGDCFKVLEAGINKFGAIPMFFRMFNIYTIKRDLKESVNQAYLALLGDE